MMASNGHIVNKSGVENFISLERSTLNDLGSIKTGRHKQRRDAVVMGMEATREFTPSMDYRHLLSTEAQVNLAEWEANYDQRAKRAEECEKMMANGAKAAQNGDKGRSLPRTDDLPGYPLSEPGGGLEG